MFDRIHLWSPLVLGLFSGRFFITVLISVLVIGFFIIFISSWFSLRRLNFSNNLPISSRLSILLPYSCSEVYYKPLYFCIVYCNLSFFIYFVDLILLSFFLDESGERFVNFVYLLKEPAFIFINLYYCFFHFFLIYFYSDLYDLFPSANLGGFFVLLFPVVLGIKLGCLFNVFVSWGRTILL